MVSYNCFVCMERHACDVCVSIPIQYLPVQYQIHHLVPLLLCRMSLHLLLNTTNKVSSVHNKCCSVTFINMHDVITHFANQDCVLFCVGTKLRQSQLFE